MYLLAINEAYLSYYKKRIKKYELNARCMFPLYSVNEQLYHIILYRVHLAWTGFELATLVVIGTDYTGSCKSNYHTITTTTAPTDIVKDYLE
jgi:hypothetical protein